MIFGRKGKLNEIKYKNKYLNVTAMKVARPDWPRDSNFLLKRAKQLCLQPPCLIFAGS